jgi:hypothetical protein
MASYNVASIICQALGGGGGGGGSEGVWSESVQGKPKTVSYLQLSQQTTMRQDSGSPQQHHVLADIDLARQNSGSRLG